MRVHTTHGLVYSGPLDAFDERTDRLYEALLDLDVIDPDLSANLVEGTAEVEMVVEGATFQDAVVASMVAMRTAIHAIGDATPGWDEKIEEVAYQVRLIKPADDTTDIVPA